MTTTAAPSRRRPWWRLAGYLIKRATLAELLGYLSIYRFVFRRPRVPPGAVGFSYHQPVLGILIAFIAVSAVELVVVDLIVRRWPSVRIVLLILSIWGLVWMFGMLFGMLTRPHAVGPVGIRVRYGSEVDIPIAWDDISSVARRQRSIQEKQPKVTVDGQGHATLHMRVGHETNMEVILERAIELRLPSGSESVSRVALYVDDPT